MIQRSWDGWHPVTLLLLPLTGLFCLLSWIRRASYHRGWLTSHKLKVPVIVVGNITVGGTGKTPLIVWLAQRLMQMGHRPGIVLRGYGGTSGKMAQEVTATSRPEEVGDEAVLIKHRTHCPVFVGSRRVEAGRRLLAEHDCDLLLSDDGLQHYALQRDLEIAVIDGERRFGNALCLPAGPLREPTARLQQVDLVIVNGAARAGEFAMRVVANQAISLIGGESRPLREFRNEPVHAIAGIGYPERFFATLREAGLRPVRHPYADHHAYTEGELQGFSGETVLMTEKDGVKCAEFAQPGFWYVPAMAQPDEAFQRAIESKIERLTDG
ncbi:MAG: tetraacyldisaccharide 4'-kinase [Candidatus Thiodiazotropha sp.]